MNKDLTIGKPTAVLTAFCLPLFGSVLFQQLYTLADSFVAGKFINNNALAAVGNSYEITLFFIAFAFGCNIGCSVIVSRLFGAKKYTEMKTAVYTSLLASGILCTVLMCIGLTSGSGLLRLIHTPDSIFSDSKLYLQIYILGLPFVFFYNVSTGIFSAMGDSKTPFRFLVCSSLSNIGMDILFVAVFQMGIAGVAWATFICQGVSCILSVIFVFRRFSILQTDEKPKIFSKKLLIEIAQIAVPSIFQQSFISVGNIIIQGIINSFGAAVIAGYSASVKLNNMLITSLTTLGNGISNYTAQNIGAQKYIRVRDGFHAGCRITLTICISVTLLYFFAGDRLLYLFLDSPTGDAVSAGTLFLRIISPFYCTAAIKLVSDGVLRGAGHMRAFMTATFTDLLLRVILAKVLSATSLQSTGIWMAWPIGWLIAMIMSYNFYTKTVRSFPSEKTDFDEITA